MEVSAIRLISWNVNGLRALLRNAGLQPLVDKFSPDIVCLQETKADTPFDTGLPLFRSEWNISERKGYAGTMCLFRKTPQSVVCGLGNKELDGEGRVLTLEYPSYFLVNVYVPQSQGGLERWYYRLAFDTAFTEYAEKLIRRKPVIVCGDFNVAHSYIDIYPENTRNFENTPGFKEEERGAFDNLLSLGFVDTYRLLHPDESAYTWWSGRFKHKEQNRGRRLDYFLVSENIAEAVISSEIITDFTGSDHAPITLEIRV